MKDDPHAKAVLDSLTIEHTLLFVGCGDTVLDPNFTRLIEWGKEALKDVAPRHYLLCRTLEIADFQKKLAGAPWLQPLDYGAEYIDLVPFLREFVPPGGIVAWPKSIAAVAGPSFDLDSYQKLQWAEKTAPNPQQDPLPLPIELREYARLRHEGNATSYLEYLHHGASVRWHFDQAQLDSWLKTNPSVVLFDGLDEVFDPTLRNECFHSHPSFCRSIHLRPRPGYLTRHRLPAPRVARRGLPPLHAARVG